MTTSSGSSASDTSSEGSALSLTTSRETPDMIGNASVSSVGFKSATGLMTRPCRYHFGHGRCKNGDNCTFRHDEPVSISVANSFFGKKIFEEGEVDEILACSKAVRTIVVDKATLCPEVVQTGKCFNKLCKHAHDKRNLQDAARFLAKYDVRRSDFPTAKTRNKGMLCVHFETIRGFKDAANCTFAHGMTDLYPRSNQRIKVIRTRYKDWDGGLQSADLALEYAFPARPQAAGRVKDARSLVLQPKGTAKDTPGDELLQLSEIALTE